MDLFTWIIGNKETIKLFYALIVVFICVVIVLKTDRLFRLSLHKGIRYFRNAFFFYGIGFALRFFLGSSFVYKNFSFIYIPIINVLFEFFLIMAGFFLLYSLLWKKIETGKEYPSSLLNPKLLLFYFMAVIIVFLDYLWEINYLMFFSQVMLFAFASIISYANYKKSRNNYKFLKFYFIAMILSFIAWTLNALAALYFNWNQTVMINIYVLNLVVFLLFLFGVIKATK